MIIELTHNNFNAFVSVSYTHLDVYKRQALHVACGKGTYVRTLVEDIGAALGVPATLAALRRTQAGPYTQEQAVGFAQIQQARDEGRLEELLLSVETVFTHLPVSYTHLKSPRACLLSPMKTWRCFAAKT